MVAMLDFDVVTYFLIVTYNTSGAMHAPNLKLVQ
jgi:hypothetical protein